jgi:hypothetical protein
MVWRAQPKTRVSHVTSTRYTFLLVNKYSDISSDLRPSCAISLLDIHLLPQFMNYSKLASHATTTTTTTLRKSLVSHRFLARSLPQRYLATATTSTSITFPSAPYSSNRRNILPCRDSTLLLRGQNQIRRSSTTPQSSQAEMLLNTNSKKHKVTVIGSGNWWVTLHMSILGNL